jgi:hypothetical protein
LVNAEVTLDRKSISEPVFNAKDSVTGILRHNSRISRSFMNYAGKDPIPESARNNRKHNFHLSAETKFIEALGALSATKRKQTENRQWPIDSAPV